MNFLDSKSISNVGTGLKADLWARARPESNDFHNLDINRDSCISKGSHSMFTMLPDMYLMDITKWRCFYICCVVLFLNY